MRYPIDIVERLRTPTSEGEFTHAGILIDPETTLESLWTVKRQNIFDAYCGQRMIVGRFTAMTNEAFGRGWAIIAPYEGKLYPVTRLVMFLLLPTLVKYITLARFLGLGLFSDVVCSELVGLFSKYAGMEGFKQFRGLMPAHLADRIKRWDSIDVMFDGVLRCKNGSI
jgi:hypothetical protein